MKLGTKSITHRAIDTALESGMFSDIVLSTDSDEIIDHCQEYENQNKIIIDKRPTKFASDEATVLQAALELINRLSSEGNAYDTFTIMLATCPFRSCNDITSGFDLFNYNLDAVISVTEYSFPWEFAMDMDVNEFIKPTLKNSPLITKKTRTQDKKRIYHPNGAFYICNWNKLIENENFFVGKVKGYIMDAIHSQDIDDENDLILSNYLLNKGHVK